MPLHIVCLKWGTKYPAEYVNRLYRMVRKNLTIDFNFHCLTENAEGLDSAIHVLPLEINTELKGWWYKLQLFKENFYGLQGELLFLDLDVVIVNNFDELVQMYPGEFVIIKDLQKGKVYNSSFFRFTIGQYAYIWNRFCEEKASIMQRMHGDQDWISEVVGEVKLWPKDQVVSYKKQCDARSKHSFGHAGQLLRRIGLLRPQGIARYPETARIVYFHGKPDPDDVADAPYDMWKKAPWIKSAWQDKSEEQIAK